MHFLWICNMKWAAVLNNSGEKKKKVIRYAFSLLEMMVPPSFLASILLSKIKCNEIQLLSTDWVMLTLHRHQTAFETQENNISQYCCYSAINIATTHNLISHFTCEMKFEEEKIEIREFYTFISEKNSIPFNHWKYCYRTKSKHVKILFI